MKRFFPVLLLAAASTSLLAQEPDPKGITAKSKAYHEYRLVETAPSYGLKKVKALVAKIKTDKDDNPVLGLKAYDALSVSEKFTYCMLNAENFDQNCAEMPGILNEERKIFAFPAGPFYDQFNWSKRQEAFLKGHRGTVVQLLRATIKSHSRVGANLKQAIIDLDVYQLIPDLVAAYKRSTKDKDILSLLCVLMKNTSFKPFVVSPTYKTLYGDAAASYKSYIDATPANESWLIHTALKLSAVGIPQKQTI
jgi:hypothetical protein